MTKGLRAWIQASAIEKESEVPPHQLDDDLYGWIRDNFFPVAHSGQGEIGAGFRWVLDGDPTDFKLDAKPLSDQSIGFGKVTDQPGSNRSTSN